MHRRPALIVAVLFASTAMWGGGSRADGQAPFDRSLYTEDLSLGGWVHRDEPEPWEGRKVRLGGVWVVGEGHAGDEIYATSCDGGRLQRPSPQAIDVRCPLVYLGRLAPDDARQTLAEMAGRPVNVYLTIGQVIPEPFVRKFGVLEAQSGAWIEDGERYVHVEADVRVFGGNASPGAEAAAREAIPAITPETVRSYFEFGYRLRHDGAVDFRPLARTSILHGMTEFHVKTSLPSWFTIESLAVSNHALVNLEGEPQRLCRSSNVPSYCVADFGKDIAGRHLILEAIVLDADGAQHVVDVEYATLDSHPRWIGAPGFVGHVEHEQVERLPADRVTRLVRIETAGSGARGAEYRTDLPTDGFRVEVAGIKGASIESVEPPLVRRPEAHTPVLIPIFLNASIWFVERGRGESPLEWLESYTSPGDGIVAALRHGLERSARSGMDADVIVVDYAATARRFGPFQLHPGEGLTADQQEHNRLALDALTAHLLEPPPPEWRLEREEGWVSDLASAMHTLNDLHLRTYPGLVAAILVTDGWNNPVEFRPRFLHDLWPERLEELNRPLHADEAQRAIRLLDQGLGLQAEDVDRFLATEDAPAPRLLATHLRRLDPGGMSTLRPHYENRLPQMDALFVPSAASLHRDVQQSFSRMIREDFGGEIYRLRKLEKTGVTFDALILRVRDQIRSSYVVTADVPNLQRDGRRHLLKFQAVDAGGRKVKGRLRFMPYYTSSRSVQDKLPTLAGSPFVPLRLLAAYELRRFWDDDDLRQLLVRRIADEGDAWVRKILYESSISIDLKRLQTRDERTAYRREAYDRLAAMAGVAGDLPDPELARDAANMADWYRRRYPERLGDR